MHTVGIISLGCPRNLTDSEVMVGSLKALGLQVRDVAAGVDICIINTCSFIEPARKESIDTILEAARMKERGDIKYLVVCGCLPQMAGREIKLELPEVDMMIGTSDFPKLPQLISKLVAGKKKSRISNNLDYIYSEKSPRELLTPAHYAYVKIAEGCSNRCSYCMISKLRGNFRSRSVRSVVAEIDKLSRSGRLKEVNIIGQDITSFGKDRRSRAVLSDLLKAVASQDNSVEWIRLLYTHPAHYTDELIAVIAAQKKICKYLDLPVQHISDKILRSMNRHTKKRDIIELIKALRARIPNLTLRTSVIVGFPGEDDKDFEELLKFLHETKFERLGAFTYSREAGTAAARMKDQVPEAVKKARFEELMRIQKNISLEINRKHIGHTMKVLIDEKNPGEKESYIGRTEGDAPEIDGSVFVSGANVRSGHFYDVDIKDALEYDLIGDVK